jgi:hypothetical protein
VNIEDVQQDALPLLDDLAKAAGVTDDCHWRFDAHEIRCEIRHTVPGGYKRDKGVASCVELRVEPKAYVVGLRFTFDAVFEVVSPSTQLLHAMLHPREPQLPNLKLRPHAHCVVIQLREAQSQIDALKTKKAPSPKTEGEEE